MCSYSCSSSCSSSALTGFTSKARLHDVNSSTSLLNSCIIAPRERVSCIVPVALTAIRIPPPTTQRTNMPKWTKQAKCPPTVQQKTPHDNTSKSMPSETYQTSDLTLRHMCSSHPKMSQTSQELTLSHHPFRGRLRVSLFRRLTHQGIECTIFWRICIVFVF
jgi:hypothetical protein